MEMARRLPVRGKDLQKSVISYARSRGYHCAHFPSVETKQGWRTAVAADAKGWPDIFLVRDRALAIEIKGDGDTIKPDQEQWKVWFERAGIEHYVIRPADWPERVQEILG